MRFIVALLAILMFTQSAHAVEDTPENRDAQIQRYLKVVPVAQLVRDFAIDTSKKVAAEYRGEFIALVTKHADIEALTLIVKGAMAATFTAEEVKAQADLFESPEFRANYMKAMGDFHRSSIGISVIKKRDAYLATLRPALDDELMKTYLKAKGQSSPSEK